MKTSIAASLFAFSVVCLSDAQAACVLTSEKVTRLRPGATLEQVERALGCKLQQQSSTGFGDTAQDIYATQDDAGSRAFVLMGRTGRLVRSSFQPRVLNPPQNPEPPRGPARPAR